MAASKRGAQPAMSNDGNDDANTTDGDASSKERFAWLLAPIKDLAGNWNVDIAAELQKYLIELDNAIFSDDNLLDVDGQQPHKKMNFSEAALLIQGSASVYSKKVDYLHSLCMELLSALKRQKPAKENQQQRENQQQEQETNQAPTAAQSKQRDKHHGLSHLRHLNLEEPLAPLTDVIKRCDNINLIREKSNENEGIFVAAAARIKLVRPSMPLCLMPLQEFEKSGVPLLNERNEKIGDINDLWMNRAKVHKPTGTLLLDASNIALLNVQDTDSAYAECVATSVVIPSCADQSIAPSERDTANASTSAAQTGATVSPNMPMDTSMTSVGDDVPMDISAGSDDFGDDVAGPADTTSAELDRLAAASLTGVIAPPPPPMALRPRQMALDPIQEENRQRINPDEAWRGLDLCTDQDDPKHEILSNDQRCKWGSTYSIPKSARNPAIHDFIDAAAAARRFTLPTTAGWKVPEDTALHKIFVKANKQRVKRQEGKSKNRVAKKRRTTVDAQNDVIGESTMERNVNMIFDGSDENDNDRDDSDDYDYGGAEENMDIDENTPDGRTVSAAELEREAPPPIFDEREAAEIFRADRPSTAMTTYEDIIRQYLRKNLEKAQKDVVLSDLGQRVQTWEKRVEPVIRQEAERRNFDIHEYGTDLLNFCDETNEPQSSGKEKKKFNFTDFVRDKKLPQWEVSRYFLSTLMLANAGNVELGQSGEEGTEESINTLTMEFKTRERHHERMDDKLTGMSAPSTSSAMDAE